MPAPSRYLKVVRKPISPQLAEWIDALASEDRKDREAARLALVSVGRHAVVPLLRCLQDERVRVRWEAAKTLVDLADPRAARAFVSLLEDEESGVRWLAAEGLVALERDALPPLLAALERGAHSQHLREGAHHVLRELHVWKLVDLLTPLMKALEQPHSEVQVPIAASHMLDSLHREPPPKWRKKRARSRRAAPREKD